VSEVLVAFLKDSGYLNYLTRKTSDVELDLINQFYKKIREFEESTIDPVLRNFIEQINLEIESGHQGKLEFNPEQGPDMVKIMTIHSAKGLEFKYVFLVNLTDRKFPTVERKEPIEIPRELVKEIIPEGDVHLGEERRLCYVAMTRAKEKLFFTSADNYHGLRKKKLSRFLIEMGFAPLEILGTGKKHRKKVSLTGFDATPAVVTPDVEELAPKAPRKTSGVGGVILPSHFSFSQLAAFGKQFFGFRRLNQL
ncbi:unnamed protein product, partial [marine sediment metagenome]